ncbi:MULTISPECIES: DNA polymerase III subunit gamma/tau [unclassified Undibacterium]|uniref:DNA polymerase III subunit gamma/tau n=1 Tax=unclassified Undibacterium TaxID=2630295 RepID=UPI002AC8C6E2|nr:MULTISPECIES: DNA polymerase III subunit gamma/tau [unclassified Undibacterium]MEB0138329.1 DNA polymerase III subunit gamma/tau [Undibacterium sp. CCC2.1]MEB0172706.1 DNA polymerase III subunit gamma/tau [Undibacterium sp. CCC1.1]MEB0174704.1 DNA polymerase III subunit gamma/tau [Undibacterium sp. CCC3.4]MEB0213901.1 DNA polymerase III subunit gamma/tau [Undibacterium sp. 5I2]WPX42626.1 DNA polymerase III subunit gamma/tau [Undibacterium sp. CCC3.4]
MSYQVLARKYRPKSFQTLVGQEHVVRALTHALEQQRLHHAYLFTGTRGVGKTTLSRILAKSFNCEQGITANPCGVCDACTAIDAGRFVDYIEMDAASNRGVDEMAALLEQAIYAPSNARFKVYMIDEVHMLTNHAFNAMLKTLEEPPAHVKFILATTDPQKIPVTVLSRCLQFNLKQMPPAQIISHLDNILGQEQIAFEVPALRLLAQGAQGSMRDALSLTDQAIAYAAGKVTLEAVQGMLGALDQSYLIRVLDALVSGDGKTMLDIADEMAARSLSYKSALQDLGTLLHQVAVAQMVPTAIADDLPEREQVLRLAGLLAADQVQLYYQIAVHGRNELALAPDEYAGFSMCLLRMLAFRPLDAAAEQSAARVAPSAAAAALPSAAPPVRSRATAPAAPPAAALAVPAVTASVMPASEVGSKPMSPALAALAAARAGSNKHAPGRSAAAAAPAALMPAAPASRTKAAAVLPRTAPSNAATDAPISAAAAPAQAPAATAGFVPDMQAVGMDDMPPPWDEAVFEVAPVVAPAVPDAAPSVIAVSVPVAAAAVAPALPALAVAGADRILWQGPVPALGWDGDWPVLAASLPVRGVAQQLAQQSELIHCSQDGNAFVFALRVPLSTLLSSGSGDKLSAALSERFGQIVRVEAKIGAVELTANTQAVAAREVRQQFAETAMQNDSFVQTLIREFGAAIVTGSVRPV